MDDNICPICIEPITEKYKPYNCIHDYHKECIDILESSGIRKKYSCSLCQAKKKIPVSDNDYLNYNFNNMLEGEVNFDVQRFINKWTHKNCIKSNHKLYLETLGDWGFNNSERDLKMNYKIMYVECKECNKNELIK